MAGFDLHVHTSFCDGQNSAEEMVLAALDLGLDCLGFSAHSYTAFDESFCLPLENTQRYKDEIQLLKEKYHGKLQILCGIEQDLYSTMPTHDFDYVIGSVHYVYKDGAYLSIDESLERTQAIINQHYEGDYFALCADYYKNVGSVLATTKADIVGHFDLITKFCECGIPFAASNPRYVAAWQKAVDQLLPYGKIFECNTGAISRGYRSFPYPSEEILRYLYDHNARVILSSDSHNADTLCYQFDEWRYMLKQIGFEHIA